MKTRVKLAELKDKYRQLPVQLRASFWFLICSFMQKGISIITTPIFTRLLSTAEYGQYNVFNSWFSILSIFITLSLYNGTYLQGLVKFDKLKDEYSSSLQGLSTLLALTWLGIYFLFRNFWNKVFDMNTIQMVCLIVMCWTTSVFGFWATEQRVEYKYITLIVVTVLVTLLKAALGIVAVVICKTDRVTARIVTLTAIEFLVYIWLFLAQMRKGKKFFSKDIWVYALGYAIPLIPHYLSTSVLSGADRIMIKVMVDESSAGIYSLAYSIAQVMNMFNTSLIQAMDPWLYQKIKQRRTGEMQKAAYPSLIAVGAISLLVIAFAPEVVSIFAPPEYREAIYVIPPVAMSVYFMFSYHFFACFEFYYEHTKYIASATMVVGIANIGLNYVFIHIFGYVAAGYTTLFCYVMYAAAHYCFMRKVCKDEMGGVMPYKTGILIAISAVFMVLGGLFMITYDHATFIRYGIVLALLLIGMFKRKKVLAMVSWLLNLRKTQDT